MPFSISCDSCGASFAIPDDVFERKVAGRVVTVRCKQCRKDIRVDGTKRLRSAESSAADGASLSVRPPAPDAPIVDVDSALSKAPGAPETSEPGPTQHHKPTDSSAREVAATDGTATISPASPAARGGVREKPASVGPSTTGEAVATAKPAGRVDAATDEASAAASSEQTTSTKGVLSSGRARGAGTEASRRTQTASPKSAPLPKVWAVSFADNDDRELTENQIAKELQGGSVTGRTIVWTQGMPDWKAIADVPELARHVVAKVVAPPSREPAPPPRRQHSAPFAAAPPLADPATATPLPSSPASLAVRQAPKPAPPPSPLSSAVGAAPFSSVSVPTAPSTPAAPDETGPSAAPTTPLFSGPSRTLFDPTAAPGSLGSMVLPANPTVTSPAAPSGISPIAQPAAPPPAFNVASVAGPASTQLDYDFSLGDAAALRKRPPLLWIGLGAGLIALILIIVVSVGGSDEAPAIAPTPNAQVPGQSAANVSTHVASDSRQARKSGSPDESRVPDSSNRRSGSALLEPPRSNTARSDTGDRAKPGGNGDFADTFAKQLGK